MSDLESRCLAVLAKMNNVTFDSKSNAPDTNAKEDQTYVMVIERLKQG
jgi:hypothetical protein